MDMKRNRYMQGHSMRRFAWYFALAGLGGALLGLAGAVMDWSGGLSFVAAVIVGTTISMAALRENPLNWFRQGPPQRQDRRPS
jgi:hypothetical protein